jgi:1,4-alpha-glucan branching enzyme
MNINTPVTPAKSARSKGRRSGSQGFIPELNALSDRKTRDPSQTESVANESASPVQQHGAAMFRLEAPMAQTVKLVADFTGWEKNPLDLRLGENGVWQITVALPPGRYAYRFLVDGEWQDDPQCGQYEANSFGTANAVVEVV